MRILQVTPCFYPALAYGGPVPLIDHLSKELARRGHEVTVYTTDTIDKNTRQKPRYSEIKGVKVYYFRNVSNSLAWRRYFLAPGMILQLQREIKGFDVVHVHGFRDFPAILVHYYAKKHDIPYVVDAHGSTLRIGKRALKWSFDVAFGNRILRDASRVIAETEVGVNEYKEMGVSQDKIVLLPPPRDFGEFTQLPSPGLFRREFNIKEKHIIMFLGRINWIKGLDFLVESFSELAQSKSDVILVIVGPDDGHKPTLEKLVDRLNLSDRVLFTGFLSGEGKLSALVDANVMVQTSVYEQGVGVPFEAVLCGLPIIVTKHTGAGEDVKKIDAGYLVEYGNKNELRDMMEYVLDNPAEAAGKTQKAREYVKANLSLEKGIEKYERLYADCIAAREVNQAK